MPNPATPLSHPTSVVPPHGTTPPVGSASAQPCVPPAVHGVAPAEPAGVPSEATVRFRTGREAGDGAGVATSPGVTPERVRAVLDAVERQLAATVRRRPVLDAVLRAADALLVAANRVNGGEHSLNCQAGNGPTCRHCKAEGDLLGAMNSYQAERRVLRAFDEAQADAAAGGPS